MFTRGFAIPIAVVLAAGTASAQSRIGAPIGSNRSNDRPAPTVTVADLTPPSTTTGYNDPRYQSPYGTGMDGVARLLMRNSAGTPVSGCTGSLLWTGVDVLTAAHCVSSGNGVINVGSVDAGFLNASGGLTTISSSAIYVAPGYTGNVVDGHDLAVIHLNRRADDWMTRYGLFQGNPMYQPVTFVGYGLTGNGNTGGVVSTQFNDLFGHGSPVRRLGSNSFESTYDGSYLYSGFSAAILMSDFDNGTAAKNTLCNFWGGPSNPYGIPTPTLNAICNAGAGINEVGIGAGDSGGPAFVFMNGQYQIAGVASFGSIRCYSPANGTTAPFTPQGTCPTGYQVNGGYFGSYAGHVAVGTASNLGFIYSATPEPSSLALLGTGLASLVPMIRRKRTRG